MNDPLLPPSETRVDLETWERADTYRWFRRYSRPHYAITTRVDVSHLMRRRRADGVSPYIGCLYAIGTGINAVPAMKLRFRANGDVIRHDAIGLSFTVPRDTGGFAFSFQPVAKSFDAFRHATETTIATVRAATDIREHAETTDAVAYLSCLPWLDFTGLDHAVPHADECIPRISWGKIVETAHGHDMALNIQVHHALTDGEDLGQLVAEIQRTLNRI